MALLIDPANRRIVLDSANVTAQAIYRAWADWAAENDHLKYLPAFSTLGGEALGGGRYVPGYYFLVNGWRVRPMEADQHLVIDGNLIVAEGGSPVVPTLGVFRVVAEFTVPVQAQAMITDGSGGGSATVDADAIARAIVVALRADGTPRIIEKPEGVRTFYGDVQRIATEPVREIEVESPAVSRPRVFDAGADRRTFRS